VLLAIALAALIQDSTVDTTFTVQRGQRLELHVHAGDLTVRGWNRNAARVRAELPARAFLEIDREGAAVRVDVGSHRGPPPSVDYEIMVPDWMPLALSGVNTSVRVDGVQAPITVETVDGDVEVTGGSGNISLSSVQGGVTLAGAKGHIEANSVNSDVVVRGASGQIFAEAVNGEVRLERVECDEVNASSVNGDVTYDGPVHPTGHYRLATHNGDVMMTVPEGASAVISVSSFQGDFESSFPVTLRERRGRRFTFTLGSGSARVELESFQGTIRLVRPGGIRVEGKRGEAGAKPTRPEPPTAPASPSTPAPPSAPPRPPAAPPGR